MESDSSEERFHDQSNAAGGGSSTFAMFGSASAGGGLPSQPGAYEDFEFPSPFDFGGLFASSAPGASGLTGSSNPFSPSAYPSAYARPPSPSSAPSPAYSSYASNGTQPPPAVASSAAPQASSLFDASESALFSSFLHTLDVDPNFLFNPVLPPGMPSPPPAILPREEDGFERERLRREVGGMSLGTDPQSSGWSASTREVDVKPVIAPEPQPLEPFEDDPSDEDETIEDDTENDPDFETGGRGSTTRSRRTRSGAQQAASGRGAKKPRVQKVEEPDEPYGEDVEMAGNEETVMGPPSSTTSRRRTARQPGARRTSSAASTRPAAAKARAAATQQRSPSAETSQSPPLDRKAPLTETQKRSNHIQSEQKRRNAIRNGFKDLVDILSAGEMASGIIVAPPDTEDDAGRKKKGKGSGRGRGRKGEVGAGASKSVVLNKAAEYILWLERGNDGLEKEVMRVEQALRDVGLDGF